MAQNMPDWSELLALIARGLNLIEDYSIFRTVCKSWHAAATKNNFNSDLPRVPWLMLAEEDGSSSCRKFFSLYNGMILKKRIPKASRKLCMESLGWLITVGEDEGEVSLLHPFPVFRSNCPIKILLQIIVDAGPATNVPFLRKQFCQLVLVIHPTTFSWSLMEVISSFGNEEI
ncbi:hypothetical protein KY285_017559 [Solanum tuberosum]|uniref:Ubiquitin-protein ligase n=1 Tax=Solanum tuberosum TaxID=4113 RepID=M1BJK1_SOLTU|nr:hypothetical protein KY285_017559 [Solanum tuberosum]